MARTETSLGAGADVDLELGYDQTSLDDLGSPQKVYSNLTDSDCDTLLLSSFDIFTGFLSPSLLICLYVGRFQRWR